MKLPVSWLKKYVDVTVSPERLAELLTMSGTAVERVERRGDEAILEVEVTTNRPDCLSVLGLAREVSALTGRRARFPKVSAEGAGRLSKAARARLPVIRVLDKEGCPKYTGRLIRGVSVKPSPAEMTKALEGMGARPINNIVDITNFVLFEMGQPLHAFDADKLKGGMILVRRAEDGERFLGIDGKEYFLDKETLVVADEEGPVAIAGVIGGKNTEVTEETKNVLLESAYFDPVLVRRASRRHKLSTESSYRFERGVDWEGVALASRRAADLAAALAGGRALSVVTAEGRPKKAVRGSGPVTLRFDRLGRLLGVPVPGKRAAAILNRLGFGVKRPKKDRALVSVGSWRRDLSQEADLVEEVLRIEGFDKIPSTLPATRHEEESVEDKKAALALELKKFLAALGFREIITYSLLSKKALADSGFEEWRRAQKIVNPVSAEQEFLRPGLLPGMLQVIYFNICRKASSFKLFEIGNCYVDDKEETILALSLYGALEENWQRKSPATFYDLKGAVESALRFLNAGEGEWREEVPCPEPGRRASPYARGSSLWIKGVEAVRLGEVGKDLLAKWDIPKEVYFAELLLDRVLAARKSETFFKVKPTPRFPSVRRDIAFIIDEGVRAVDLEKAMREEGAPHLQEVVLFDRYAGKNVPEGKQSLAFSLFYRKEGTFTDEEINALQARVTEGLKERYGVEFR